MFRKPSTETRSIVLCQKELKSNKIFFCLVTWNEKKSFRENPALADNTTSFDKLKAPSILHQKRKKPLVYTLQHGLVGIAGIHRTYFAS